MNATRFYWDKLQGATDQFRESKTEETLHTVQNTCCELVNEFRCPRLVQIDAYKLRSQCYPDNYWFAKANLDLALELIAKCEKSPITGDRERTLAVLGERRQGVEAMLQERTKSYEEVWKSQGKEVPTEDEWYKIVEGETGDSDVVYVVEGSPLKGSDFPFTGPVSPSLLAGKTLPPPRGTREVDATENTLHEQHGTKPEEQEWQEVDIMELAMKEGMKAAGETAE